MVGLQKAMVGLVVVIFLLLFYNLLNNRPRLLPPDTSQENQLKNTDGWRVGDSASPSHQSLVPKAQDSKLWGTSSLPPQPCWRQPSRKTGGKQWGYVLVTCSRGPHYHRSQIANAVVVARQLGATLVLPTIKESEKEPNSNFEDLYNVKHFIASLEGIVRIVGRLPNEVRHTNMTAVQVPHRITQTYIQNQIRPFLEQNVVILLDGFLPDSKFKGEKEEDMELEAIRCLVAYDTLWFMPQIQKLGDRMLNRMREAAQTSKGHFVAVDLRTDMLQHKTCNHSNELVSSRKRCLPPHELGVLLKSFGFPSETAIYLTQSRLDASLDPLKSIYPNIFTKEYSMPFNEENQFLFSGKTQVEMAVDFYVCMHSDVFVPAIPGTFYATVAAQRIAVGRTQILVPALKGQATSPETRLSLAISQFVLKKDQPVHSCFCKKLPSANIPSVHLDVRLQGRG